LQRGCPRTPVALELIGHSSPNGSDSPVHPDLSGITTASAIVREVRAAVEG